MTKPVEFSDPFVGGQHYTTSSATNGLILLTDVEDSEGHWEGPTAICIDGGGMELSLGSGDTPPEAYVALCNGDILCFPVSKVQRLEVDVSAVGLSLLTDIVIGLTSDIQTDQDDIDHGAWFTVSTEVPNSIQSFHYLVCKSRDDQHRTSKTTSTEIGDDWWQRLVIDFSNGLTDVRFFADTPKKHLKAMGRGTTFNISAASSGNLQFMAKVQSLDAGEEPTLYLRNLKIFYEA